jgi:ketosteroid isomerase-like protein
VIEVFGDGDFAYVRANYTLDLDIDGFTPYSGKYLAVLRRQADGSWLISHHVSNCSSDCS